MPNQTQRPKHTHHRHLTDDIHNVLLPGLADDIRVRRELPQPRPGPDFEAVLADVKEALQDLHDTHARAESRSAVTVSAWAGNESAQRATAHLLC